MLGRLIYAACAAGLLVLWNRHVDGSSSSFQAMVLCLLIFIAICQREER